MTRAVLDGDVIAYQAASLGTGEGSLDWGDGNITPIGGEKLALSIARHKVKSWCRLAFASDDPIIVFSDQNKENFRWDFCPHYKHNREGHEKPEDYAAVVEYLKDRHLTYEIPRLEGDDVIGLLLTGENGAKYTGVSTDKDIKTIPGNICHVAHKATDQMRPFKNTMQNADRYWMTQTIMGDQVDGYKGAPGAGAKRAESVLKDTYSLQEMWEKVLYVYADQFDHKSYGKKFTQETAYDEALMNARCARILRYGDWNKETGEVNLWTP